MTGSGGIGVGSGGGTSLGTGGATTTTTTCVQAAGPYTLASVQLDPSLFPHVVSQGWNAAQFAQVPMAVNPSTGAAYVGMTRDLGAGALAAVIVPATEGAATPVVTAMGATLGGLAVTNNGFGVLAFDPNDNVDARTWAAVRRFDATGTQQFATDLFRSANLTDANTKGAPGTSRFAYLPTTDQLIAYFGHTELLQGVRHQGGFLATVSATGAATLVSGWWGSHNLDQRLSVNGSQTVLLGLGDAYPKGMFFSTLTSRPATRVIFTMAGDGQGTTNGQLGGIADFDDAAVTPFITNDSISQTLTPGDWPNIDQAVAEQIEQAAANGNKMGMLSVPRVGALPNGDLPTTWLNPALGVGARLERLKVARYGAGALLLLGWAEVTGTGRNATRAYFTMVVDRGGAICQAKTPLPAANGFTAGDDWIRRADGKVTWANIVNNRIIVTTLSPAP